MQADKMMLESLVEDFQEQRALIDALTAVCYVLYSVLSQFQCQNDTNVAKVSPKQFFSRK